MENILIIDDNTSTINALCEIIELKGHKAISASSAEEGYDLFKKNEISLIITDLKLPGMDGFDLIKKIKNNNGPIPIIVISAFGSIDKAVEAVKLGAFDFIKKPFSMEEIEIKIDKALMTTNLVHENKMLSLENEYLRSEFSYNFSEIIGKSQVILEVFEQIKKVAIVRSPVLILGESGTGKELVARAIHYNGNKKLKPFVRVNCAALAEGVLESELFGHEKGAFSGAIKSKPGRFEIAGEGTIFLDEIGEISLNVQVKLLRVLQEKEFERVGGIKTLKMNARIITATNKNLYQLVKENKFREDLFYRLNVVPITLPPLREHNEDIPLLINHFLKKYSIESKKYIKGIEQDVINGLVEYNWPGNIRELENIIERAIVMNNDNILTQKDFPNSFFNKIDNSNNLGNEKKITPQSFNEIVEGYEKRLIKNVLDKYNGNISKASEELRLKRTTLRYKLEKYNLLN